MIRIRKIQFGIGAVLMLTASVAGYLSAYRFGINELIASNQQKVFIRNYDVADLLSGTSTSTEVELAELMRLIVATTGSRRPTVDNLANPTTQ